MSVRDEIKEVLTAGAASSMIHIPSSVVENRPMCGGAGEHVDWKRKSIDVYPEGHKEMCEKCREAWCQESHSPLTEKQLKAVRKAHRMGYFDVPKEASQTDVADELGITSQAFSERIRRAMKKLSESVI